jgi:hypothetical protein
MNEHEPLDHTLAAWFETDARIDPPEDLFDRVVTETRSRRPSPAWLAAVRADGVTARQAGLPGRPVLLMAAIGLLLLAILASVLLAAGAAPWRLSVAPAVVTVPPSASVPIVDVPVGLSPKLAPAQVEQEVIGLIDANHLGLASEPVTVTKITLLPPGVEYKIGTGPDPRSQGGLTEDSLSWVVEATGTNVICSSFCSTWTSGAYVIDDATGMHRGGGATSLGGSSVPSQSFRGLLAANGLQYDPMTPPATGVVPSATIVKRLDPRHFASGLSLNSPMFGTVVWQDRALAKELTSVFPSPGATRAIWWVGSTQPTASGDDLVWAAFDATTGALLDTNAP